MYVSYCKYVCLYKHMHIYVQSVSLCIKYTLLQEFEYNLLDFFLYIYNFKIVIHSAGIYLPCILAYSSGGRKEHYGAYILIWGENNKPNKWLII